LRRRKATRPCSPEERHGERRQVAGRVPDAFCRAPPEEGYGTGGKDAPPGDQCESEVVAALLYLADFYTRNKRVDDAIGILNEVIKIEPGNARANLAIATLYYAMEKKQEAAGALNAYLAGDPKSEERIIQVARFYEARKQFAEAEPATHASYQGQRKESQAPPGAGRGVPEFREGRPGSRDVESRLSLFRRTRRIRTSCSKNILAAIALNSRKCPWR